MSHHPQFQKYEHLSSCVAGLREMFGTMGVPIHSPAISQFRQRIAEGFEFTSCWKNRWKVLLIQKARGLAWRNEVGHGPLMVHPDEYAVTIVKRKQWQFIGTMLVVIPPSFSQDNHR